MAGRVRDPVCGMMVAESEAVTLKKDGQTYYFCSERCQRQYQAHGGSALAPGEHAALAEEERLVAHAAPGPHAGGHAGHHAHMVADFQRRFWIS